MILAVKKDDRIVVGINVISSLADMSERDLALSENIPFWKVKGNKDCYVFADTLSFAADLLRYNDYVFKDVSDGKSIVEKVVPKIKELLGRYSQIIKDKEMDTQILIVKGNKMFTIGRFFTVSEEDRFVGLKNNQYSIGALEESSDMDLEQSILFAARTVGRMRNIYNFPLLVFDNKTKKRKVFYN